MRKSRTRIVHWSAAQGLRWLLVGAVAWLMASPAWAARVVDVRVGQHAGYSRLVFELDMPAGYKVERHSPAAGVNELVVSLDAGAESRTVRRKLDFIESVKIESESSRRSTVRVRLKGEDLKLKEMILANPPRIVLDVLNERAVAQARAGAKRKPQPELRAKDAPKKVAKAPAPSPSKPAPEPAVKPTPEPKPAASSPTSASTARDRSQTQASAVPQPPASLPDAGSGGAAPGRLALAPSKPDAGPAPKPNRNTGASAPVPTAAGSPAGMATPAAPSPRPAPTARPQPTPAKPSTPKPAAMTPPAGDGLFSLTNIAAAAGLVLLVGAAFVFIRRRNAAEVVDASAFENPLGDDNPFADLDSDEGAADRDTEDSGLDVPEPPSKTAPAAPAAAQEGADMDMVSDDARTTIMDSPASAMAMGSSGGGDVARMVQEFERRMKAMETRIDELVDAKERLERQVAAQTEELRVQRAAIARTQRAVRNLSRPGEDSPTEPALRDPARPEGPRQ